MRVAIVGVCASGKSTVARGLQRHGLDAYVVGQEHSIVSDLWARRRPDALIYLDAPLVTVRERRGPTWPEWIYDLQIQRLGSARSAATMIVDTSRESEDHTIDRIVAALSSVERRP